MPDMLTDRTPTFGHIVRKILKPTRLVYKKKSKKVVKKGLPDVREGVSLPESVNEQRNTQIPHVITHREMFGMRNIRSTPVREG